MKCDPLVHAVRTEPAGVTFDLHLPAELACFAGHFPDVPVLAGVVQIDWALHLAAAHLGLVEPETVAMRVKFMRIITPGTALALRLRHDAPRHRLDFTYHADGVLAAQGQISFAAP